jgi:hypothetical protein
VFCIDRSSQSSISQVAVTASFCLTGRAVSAYPGVPSPGKDEQLLDEPTQSCCCELH